MNIRRFHIAATAAVALLLSACASQTAPQQFSEISFSHLSSIGLAVTSIEIIDQYRGPLRDPNVEHRAPTPPAAAARRWAEDRLVATGTGNRRATYTIQQASIVEVELEGPKGVRGLITNSQAERYDAEMTVELAVFGATGTREGVATATAKRSRTVPENLTLAARERVWHEMVEALMADLDLRLQATISDTLRPFLS